MENKKARFKSGLLDFEYCASLHICQAQLDPDLVSQALGMQAICAHRAGDTRQTPTGHQLFGVYDRGYWSVDLETRNGEDIAEFLSRVTADLAPSEAFMQSVVNEGGRIECFIGVFANRLCDQILPATLLSKLGQLGIDLRLDYYGQSRKAESPTGGK
jgi:hypothetical protein